MSKPYRKDTLRKFAKRSKQKTSGDTFDHYTGLESEGPQSMTDMTLHQTPGYDTVKRFPKGTTPFPSPKKKTTDVVSRKQSKKKASARDLLSPADRRAGRKAQNVSDVRTASDAQIRRLKRIGLL